MKTGFRIDDSNHTFIIAEAGSNWKCGTFDEDLHQAKKLIDVASQAGADGVKFQTYRSHTVYAPNSGKSNYLAEHGIEQDISEIFDYLSMPYEMIPELATYCENKNIMFMSTPFSVEDAKNIDPYVAIHKLASYEINHIRLLEFLINTNKPLIISTGASTLEEVDFVVNFVKKYGKNLIGLLQCTSKYPAPVESLNLNVIPMMKQRYDVSVGLSDHSMDPVIGPVLAVGLGATIIEKHFTLDRSLNGPDHLFALNPEELKIMVKAIRAIEKAKGSGEKIILEDEKELRNFATRAIQATKNIAKGEVLVEGKNFDILRPGNNTRGMEPRFLFDVIGKKAIKDIQVGKGITEYE